MPPRKKRRHNNEIRDALDSDEETEEAGYLNTRASYLDSRGRTFVMSVSPQKKSTKARWEARRAWDLPDDTELGLDTNNHLHDQTIEGDVYNEPKVDKTPMRKPKRTLRTVCLNLILLCITVR